MDTTLSAPLSSVRPSRPLLWVAVLLFWTVPGLVALSYYYLNQVVTAQPISWSFALLTTLPNWYLWAALTPVIVALTRRNPLDGPGRLRTVLAVHVPGMIAAVLIHSAANLLLFRAAGLHDGLSAELYRVHVTTRLHANLVTYWAIVGVWHALAYYRRLRANEQEAMLLQTELVEAQMRALRMQLHPHFLFNTLNSIAALIRKGENRPAVTMLVRLSEFLRRALENRGVHEVPLSQEVGFAQRYLEIEQIRFGDALRVEVSFDDDIGGLLVPNMLLQPLVENAVHHGISRRTGTGGVIAITASRAGDELRIEIRDNGPGLQRDTPSSGTGVGLSTTRQRLERMYGDAASVTVAENPEGGAVSTVRLPRRSSAGEVVSSRKA